MIDFTKSPLLMGVVNVTPDSFSDGGQFLDTDKAIEHALKLLEEGADILDIGGESTRPGAAPVTPDEEQVRVLPVIEGIKKRNPDACVSIDTRHANTMQKAVNKGADIINDISALTHDPESLNQVAQLQKPVILMHMQGTPETMQDKPEYGDVVEDVFKFLEGRIAACIDAGIAQNNIICDPGIGFGKTLEDNLKLLKNIKKFHDLNCPVLLGASRKSFIEKICPDTPADERLPGSLAAALWGLEQRVQIFRVHDVVETKQAFAIVQGILSAD